MKKLYRQIDCLGFLVKMCKTLIFRVNSSSKIKELVCLIFFTLLWSVECSHCNALFDHLSFVQNFHLITSKLYILGKNLPSNYEKIMVIETLKSNIPKL